uniref:Genome polyprotein n=1 Tax=Freesia mosaic virus TaxID=421012 RepID=F1AC57_9POTV|nr:polyprotein [Freesia mosaic virus]
MYHAVRDARKDALKNVNATTKLIGKVVPMSLEVARENVKRITKLRKQDVERLVKSLVIKRAKNGVGPDRFGLWVSKNGKMFVHRVSTWVGHQLGMKLRRQKQQEDFVASKDHEITRIECDKIGAEPVHVSYESMRSPFWQRTPPKQEKRKKSVAHYGVNVIDKLTKSLINICSQEGKQLEVILQRKRKITCTYKTFGKSVIPSVRLPHEECGTRKKRELHPQMFNEIITLLAKGRKMRDHVVEQDITFGWSGTILPSKILKSRPYRYDEVVVRGRLEGQIVDARTKLSFFAKETITQYSSFEAQFWKGWKRAFDQLAPKETHTCQTTISNEACGEIVAAIFQMVHPCAKVSCTTCRDQIGLSSKEEYAELTSQNIRQHDEIFTTMRQAFASVDRVMTHFEASSLLNLNVKDCMEVIRLAQDQRATQLQQLLVVNNVLMKGHLSTSEELSEASAKLLEVVRWFMKHLSLVAESSLSTFRNKAASKALVNPSLLCDNQLDKNGNFVWGERGRHSKRFFGNYFEEIIPGDGYKDMWSAIAKLHPKLAVGNLIVSMDLAVARKALLGESIERMPVSDSCVSRMNGAFVHVCCCVTNDVGQAVYSDLRSPTKRHLVVGASGDPKFIDLPTNDSEKMYIAKEGFCYLNIFLAMLVNVNEDNAKDFTKMVRDRIVPELGTWPTVIDLATACYILTVFYPETRGAELPRIFVDHATKTMHVIDSFGSLTTGYHILKAGTVSQFIHFAPEQLDAEMRYYNVGGDANSGRRMRMERALIKGIFRPKLLMHIIHEDPYTLMMSLLSPCMLLNLYNVGGLEVAMREWIVKEASVSAIFATMSRMAESVSRADMVVEQLMVIRSHAGHFLELLASLNAGIRFRDEVVNVLTMMLAQSEMDSDLTKSGFVDLRMPLYEMREKIYAGELDKEWSGLSLWEKFYLITFSRKSRPSSSQPLHSTRSDGIEGKYVASRDWLLGKMRQKWCGIRTGATQRMEATLGFCKRNTIGSVLYIIRRCYRDIFYFVNVMLIATAVVNFIHTVHRIVLEQRESKMVARVLQSRIDSNVLGNIYKQYVKEKQETPTATEFYEHVRESNEELAERVKDELLYKDTVTYQGKSPTEKSLERTVAMVALLAMVFDTERSDAVFKILSKIKSVFSTLGDEVKYQSLDDIESIETEKKMTIDLELDTDAIPASAVMSAKFSDWWYPQLEQNRVLPHYRIGGEFVEFTRKTATNVVLTIDTSSSKEFLIRGAVGSGKSTNLPHLLARKGKVLLLEPTRPLAENVCKQLRKDPFNVNPTLRMRGMTTFGSSNITVMTSGFALHYYAHNPSLMVDFDFVMFDECHALDAAAMAFYCLLSEHGYPGKILKVSATPPGKECEFKTQFDVKLIVENDVSFKNFADSQGTGANIDMTKYGDNILVYVASYNDVDQLSGMLLNHGHHVSKVDGRTMKLGHVEIATKGTPSKKHFIVATNIIENGVTLDIDVVVDFGQKVVAELDCDSRCMRYQRRSISYGERIQRLGRVGRVKDGAALRIGHTESGLTEIPASISTEAAFYCFAYGLPVITHNVSVSLLSNCTVQQARTMMHFELSPFFMVELVKYNGCMHPEVHRILQPFKLRESEIELNKLAIPSSGLSRWITVGEYGRMGIHINAHDDVRIPFACRGIPDSLYAKLWEIVLTHKHDAGFGRLTSASASKIAHTLTTNVDAIPRTLAQIEQLIEEEMVKKAHFESLSASMTTRRFSLGGIVDTIRQRYMRDHSTHNIEVLQAAKAQIMEFNSATHDFQKISSLLGYGFLDTVQYQDNKEEIGKRLGLKGRWNGSLLTHDLMVCGLVAIGGFWMAWEYYVAESKDLVRYQGKGFRGGKRSTQKLKFREARDKKVGREVYGDDGTIEHYFGAAYTSKGKQKGNHTKKGMGRKNHRFVHFYGFDPAEYSFVRFVDPLTGYAIDESVTCDISLVQDEISEARRLARENDTELPNAMRTRPGIQAYFMKNNSNNALRVDMTPHNPLAMGAKSTSIAGHPEREFELRQTGAAQVVQASDVPSVQDDVVRTEGKSMCRGLRNYNPVASCICKLVNDSDGIVTTIFGLGYGPVIITNGHLFNRNNGTLQINTHHGVFRVENTTKLQIHHVERKDMVLIRMPTDFPPFPQRLKFRSPVQGEKANLIGSLFQQKNISSVVSETTLVMPANNSGYWRHWVSTKDGDCGLPMVSTSDGYILGFHGLTSTISDRNYFVPFTDNFEEDVLRKIGDLNWKRHWKHSADLIAWDGIKLIEEQPQKIFKTTKLISDLAEQTHDEAMYQHGRGRWVFDDLNLNLKAVACANSQLVTKHVIKGQCQFFQEYLAAHPDAATYFGPLLGHYRPSRLNKEAFKKDLFKYMDEIIIGEIDGEAFERGYEDVCALLHDLKFGECQFITDPSVILESLNMKAAVGSLYTGKKNEYFEAMTADEKEEMVLKSCERLYNGCMGVWNGSLKAELRPLEKVEANKTRTFTAAPIDTLLGGKVCVDDFNNRFYELNLAGPWTVGMTKFYGGWDKLMKALPEGWLYCHADGSRFDSSLTPFLINAVIRLRLEMMERWDLGWEMLQKFYTEIIYTPILTPDGTIVKKFKGNNSGQPSTVVDNTLMVILAMHYSMEKQGWKRNESKERLVFFANGDDLIIAVKPGYEGILDSLAVSFKELGLIYDFSERCHDRQELWFMSHQGHLIDGMYIPKLERERIVSILEWDRSHAIEHRAEAICAAMIEAWGYPDLLLEIRKFYAWILDHDMFHDLAAIGKLPYIAETALRKLYTDRDCEDEELLHYLRAFNFEGELVGTDEVRYQATSAPEQLDAGAEAERRRKARSGETEQPIKGQEREIAKNSEKDVDVGSRASKSVPRLAKLKVRMKVPTTAKGPVLDLDHLLEYKPDQIDLSNARATKQQFDAWFNGVQNAYELDDIQMKILMNGLMVWCIENGTSPDITGVWTMMDGDEQVEYPLRPVIENAKPTLRQVMRHFSDMAEAYIEMRNAEKPYMPRYGLQRNLRDYSLARVAFDFYEITSKTSVRAREAHMQMKAAAVANTTAKMFGLDGNIGTQEENTERHTVTDVSANMHSLLGVRHM